MTKIGLYWYFGLNVACLFQTLEYVCSLTVSLCMKPQIPAATSQANKMTRQAKNCKTEQRHYKGGPFKHSANRLMRQKKILLS